MTFGKYIQTVRVGHSLAQRVVAEKVGITHRELRDIEHGCAEPSMEVLGRLEKCYYFTPGQLQDIYAKMQPPSDTAIVAAFVALPDDYAESRERAINSLRMRDLTDDYDLVRAAGDLSGAEEYLPGDLR